MWQLPQSAWAAYMGLGMSGTSAAPVPMYMSRIDSCWSKLWHLTQLVS
jgi:hypothetical protein